MCRIVDSASSVCVNWHTNTASFLIVSSYSMLNTMSDIQPSPEVMLYDLSLVALKLKFKQDIWKGYHRTHNDVCVKVLRMFASQHDARQDAFEEFAHEALVWKQLYHENILPFLGVNLHIFFPSFSLISPWMEKHNVMSFLQKYPDFDRLKIVRSLNHLQLF
jgi:hypothetical protein